MKKTVIAQAVEALVAAPAVLLPFQQRYQADRADVRVWEKSRRVGASWTDAGESALIASAKSGSDCLYIGYSEDMTREYIDDCAMWAKEYSLAASETKEVVFADSNEDGSDSRNIKAFRIDFASGHKILALSSRPRSIRGKQGKVTIDEAAFHDDLAGLIKAALALLIWGGRVSIISSHFGEDNPFNILVKDIRAGKLPYSLHSTTFMDAVREGLYRRVCLRRGIEWTAEGEVEFVEDIYSKYRDNAAEELDCIPSASSGTYLPRNVVERCQDKAIPTVRFSQKAEFVLDPDREFVTRRWCEDVLKPLLDNLPRVRSTFGQDFGRSGDLSVIWPLQMERTGKWKTPFLVELRNIPFDCQQLILFYIIDGLPLFFHGKLDARGNGQAHAEKALQRYGPARIECVMATVQWYAEHFPKYKAAFEAQDITVPGGEDIIADHRRAILVKGRPTMDDGRDIGSDGLQRHGDSCVAGLLAWAATLMEAEPAAGATVEAKEGRLPSEKFAGRRSVGMFRKKAA
jgi:phage FluMu gp28-like protein